MDITTTRRYYADSYTWRFDGTVVEASADAKEPSAILDGSYFYPTSGGQPHDIGTLGSAHVVDVRIRESDSALLHILDTPIATGPVTATINEIGRAHV